MDTALVGPDLGGGLWSFFGRRNLLLLGSQDQSFREEMELDIGPSTRGFLSADYDKNGRRDIAAVFAGEMRFGEPPKLGGIAILLQSADSVFDEPLIFPLDGIPIFMAQEDYNEDGNLDLAVNRIQPGFMGSVAILLGNGDGTFRQGGELPVEFPGGAVMAADFNRDDDVDLAVLNDEEVLILAGNGNGTFGPSVAFDVGPRSLYLTAGDLDEDGNLDLAVAGAFSKAVAILLGDGNGAFGPPRLFVGGRMTEGMFVTDYDRDGALDIVIGDGLPEVFVPQVGSGVLFGRGDGTFYSAPQYLIGGQATGVAAADFNRDGQPDAAVSGSGGISLLLADDDGEFAAGGDIELAGGASPTAIAADDFNGDENPDLAVADSANSAWVLLGLGDGTFRPAVRHDTLDEALDITTGDFNRDDVRDLAIAGNGGSEVSGVSILLGNPDGTFQAARNTNFGTRARTVVAGDWNSDGADDLAVADEGVFGSDDAGGLDILISNVDGTFAAPVRMEAGLNPQNLAAGDVNGDEIPDLAVAADGPDFTWVVTVFLGVGDGTFQAGETLPTDFGPSGVVVDDFDQNGDGDIIVAHCCGQTDMTFMVSNGDGTFEPEVHFSGGGDPIRLVDAHLNGDRKPDLIVVNSLRGLRSGITVLINTSQGSGLTHVSAANLFVGPVAADSIVTAFGEGFATEIANVNQPATTLAGVTAKILESTGVESDLSMYFASPTQVNYLMLPVDHGRVRVTIHGVTGNSQAAEFDVVRVVPGVFFLNGDFLAAAVIQRFDTAGNDTVVNVFDVDGGNIVASPIDMVPDTDRVFILLFGTGFRNRRDLSGVQLTVGGLNVPLTYAGPQSVFPGLDQINGELSRALKGAGLVDVILTVEGRQANITKLLFQ